MRMLLNFLRDYRVGMYMLTLVCGLIDGTCLLALGGVFAQLMTGNLLFLGLALGADGAASTERIESTLGALIPFCIGALIAGLLLRRLSAHRARRRGYVVAWCVVLLAAVLAWVLSPEVVGGDLAALTRSGAPPQGHHAYNLVIVALLALAMGLHTALIKQHGVKDIATNLMTMSLTTIFSEGPLVGIHSGQWRRRGLSVVIFVAGAALAAILIRWNIALPLAVASVFFTGALVALLEGPDESLS